MGSAALLLAYLALWAPAALAVAPANDDFANAAPLEESVERLGATWGASKEPGEPDHAGDPGGASVWFSWTASKSEDVLLQVCTYGWTGLTEVYRGSSLDALEGVASSSSQPGSGCREVRFRATSATTYRIALDGYSDGGASPVQEGEYSLEPSGYTSNTPANDLFANATVLEPQTSLSLSGSTEGATREVGEPSHAGDLAGASVWYRWTSPVSATVNAFPCRGDFHPVISVYAGSELASLTPVGVPAPGEPTPIHCQLGGLYGVAFDAVAGVTYSISVDSADGTWGYYLAWLSTKAIPFVDSSPPQTFIRKRVRVHRRQARLGFFASERDSTFLCRRDRQPFEPCASPQKYVHLALGRHSFSVAAVDPAGNVDPTPAIRDFRVRKR